MICLWQNHVFEKIRFSRKFRFFLTFSKISRSQLWRILIFDLLNGSFWCFFIDRSGFSRRIERIYQKLHQNQLGNCILHLRILWQLTQDSILWQLTQDSILTLTHQQGYPSPVSWSNTWLTLEIATRSLTPGCHQTFLFRKSQQVNLEICRKKLQVQNTGKFYR